MTLNWHDARLRRHLNKWNWCDMTRPILTTLTQMHNYDSISYSWFLWFLLIWSSNHLYVIFRIIQSEWNFTCPQFVWKVEHISWPHLVLPFRWSINELKGMFHDLLALFKEYVLRSITSITTFNVSFVHMPFLFTMDIQLNSIVVLIF